MIECVSQKEMCNLALRFKAIRIGYNCSYYESIIHSSFRLIDELDIDVRNNGSRYNDIWDEQIFYSSGIYGNTGQMHIIKWYDSNDIYHECYVYYTNIDYNKERGK